MYKYIQKQQVIDVKNTHTFAKQTVKDNLQKLSVAIMMV